MSESDGEAQAEFQPRFTFRDDKDADLFDSFVQDRLTDVESALTELRLLDRVFGRAQVTGWEAAYNELIKQQGSLLNLHCDLNVAIRKARGEE